MAYGGGGAMNLGGMTYHSALGVSDSNSYKGELSDSSLKSYRLKLANVRYILIDEFSMISNASLSQIDSRLSQTE